MRSIYLVVCMLFMSSFIVSFGFADSGYVLLEDGTEGKIKSAISIGDDDLKLKYDFVVGDEILLNYSKALWFPDKVVLTEKSSGMEIFSMEHDFRYASFDLSNLAIDTSVDYPSAEYGFIVFSGILGINKSEPIEVQFAPIANNLEVCVAKSEILTVADFTDSCNGIDEVLIDCDGIIHSGYSCRAESNRYVITGNDFYGVKEFIEPEVVIEPEFVDPEPEVIEVDDDNSIDSENAVIGGFAIMFFIVLIVVFIYFISHRSNKKKDDAFHKKMDYSHPENQEILVLTKQEEEQKVKDYIIKNKEKYSYDILKSSLLANGCHTELIDKVINDLKAEDFEKKMK